MNVSIKLMVLGTQHDTNAKIKSIWRFKISIDQAWYVHTQQKTENSLLLFTSPPFLSLVSVLAVLQTGLYFHSLPARLEKLKH